MKKNLLLIFLLLSSILKMTAQPWMWAPLNTGLQTATVGVDKISMVDSNVIWCISSYYAPVHEYARSTDGGMNGFL